MASRIRQTFQRLKKERAKALVPFVTAGDPSFSVTTALLPALERGGADLIEVGVPFSDPMADGPVIQKSSERALKKGATLKKVLSLVAGFRQKSRKTSATPVLLMGYFNPILSYGLEAFARDAAKAGVDGAIVVDLPPEESGELDRSLKKHGLDLIYLLTPTSDAERIRIVCKRARGFVYFVSITGITGAGLNAEGEIRKKVAEIRKRTKLPIAIGFGISKPEHARAMGKIADGVVIGSAVVKLVESKKGRAPAALEKFVRSMKSAANGMEDRGKL
jgi:tryptophan synthase alpha chain